MNIEKAVNNFANRLPQPLASLTIVPDDELREKAKVENCAAELFKNVADIVVEKISAAGSDKTLTIKNKGQALVIEIPQELIEKSLPQDKGRYENAVVGLTMKNIQRGLSNKGYNSDYINLSSYDDLVSGHLLVVGMKKGQVLSDLTQELVRSRVTNAA